MIELDLEIEERDEKPVPGLKVFRPLYLHPISRKPTLTKTMRANQPMFEWDKQGMQTNWVKCM